MPQAVADEGASFNQYDDAEADEHEGNDFVALFTGRCVDRSMTDRPVGNQNP
jgi:hypothetical protein